MEKEAAQLKAQRELNEMRSLLRDLKDEDWQMRLKAISALTKLRRTEEFINETVPALISAIEDPNEYVRRSAIPALGDIGPEAKICVKKLIEILSSNDLQMRRAAAYSLGKIGPAAISSVPKLIDLLEKAEKEEQKAVAWALGIIGHEAAPLLEKALLHSSSEVRAGCAFALGSMGPSAIQTLGSLIKCLKDNEAQVRYQTAKAIGNLRAAKETEAAVPNLIECLSDSDPDVRWVAAEALRKIGTREAMDAWLNFEAKPEVADFAKQLFNDDKAVRIDAAQGLIKVLTPEAGKYVPQIAGALKDQLWKVKVPVAEALAKMGGSAREAIPLLRRALGDENERVRAAAANAIGKIKTNAEEAVPALIKGLKDQYREVRSASALALESIDTEEARKALKKFNWE